MWKLGRIETFFRVGCSIPRYHPDQERNMLLNCVVDDVCGLARVPEHEKFRQPKTGTSLIRPILDLTDEIHFHHHSVLVSLCNDA